MNLSRESKSTRINTEISQMKNSNILAISTSEHFS